MQPTSNHESVAAAYRKKWILLNGIAKCRENTSIQLTDEEFRILMEKLSFKIHRHGTTFQKQSQLASLLKSNSLYLLDALEDMMTIIGLGTHEILKFVDRADDALQQCIHSFESIEAVITRLVSVTKNILALKTGIFSSSTQANADKREQLTREHIQSSNLLIHRFSIIFNNLCSIQSKLEQHNIRQMNSTSIAESDDANVEEIGSAEIKLPNWCAIDLCSSNLDHLNLANMNLSHCVFGKEIRFVDLRGSKLRCSQLKLVKSLKYVQLDQALVLQLRKERFSWSTDMLCKIESEMHEARLAIDCLHYYYLFVCESKEDVSTLRSSLCNIPLDSLKMVVFLLMNDAFINLLSDESSFAPCAINENRGLIFDPSVSCEDCIDMVFDMLHARHFFLPAEMLSVSIDAKLYSLYNAIDDRKLTLLDLLELGLGDISSGNNCDEANETAESASWADRKTGLENYIQKLQTLRQQYVADRKVNEKFHDLARIGYFLISLNNPPDPSLGMNSTERLIGAIKLSIQHDVALDLRSYDISSVELQSVSFDGVRALLSASQEEMLSSSQRMQIHKRYFQAAKLGDTEEVRTFLTPPYSYPVDLQNEVGRTALMYACFEGHVDMVKMLVEDFGADLVKGTDMGGTAIQALILLKKRSSDAALSNAAEEILEYFIKSGVHFSAQALAELGDLARLKKCSSLALDSLRDDELSTRQSHTTRGSDVGAITGPSDAGEGVVHIAARSSRVDILEHCALRGVNMGRTNYAGLNALHIACSYGNTNAALYLGKHIDVNAPYRGKSNALKLALEGKHFETARSLRARYPQMKIPDIWCAVMLRDIPSVLSMIQLGSIDEPSVIPVENKLPIAELHITPKKRLSATSILSHSFSSHHVTAPVVNSSSSGAAIAPLPKAITTTQPRDVLIVEAMFHACKSGWVDLVKLLLKRFGAFHAWERVCVMYGMLRPVDVCVDEGNVHLLKIILKATKTITFKHCSLIQHQNSLNTSPVDLDVRNEPCNAHPVVRYLLNSIDSFSVVDSPGYVPPNTDHNRTIPLSAQQYCLFLRAIRKRNFSVLNLLLMSGYDCNMYCSGKHMLLHLLQSGIDYINLINDNISSGKLAPHTVSIPERTSSHILKAEMFDRLNKRSENSTRRDSSDSSEHGRFRSKNVLEFSNNAEAAWYGGLTNEIGSDRDSDDDTDYGDINSNGTVSDEDDERLADNLHCDESADDEVRQDSHLKQLSEYLDSLAKTLNIMIQLGCDVIGRDSVGNTCMHYASQFDKVYKLISVQEVAVESLENSPSLRELSSVCSKNEIASILVLAFINTKNSSGKSAWG